MSICIVYMQLNKSQNIKRVLIYTFTDIRYYKYLVHILSKFISFLFKPKQTNLCGVQVLRKNPSFSSIFFVLKNTGNILLLTLEGILNQIIYQKQLPKLKIKALFYNERCVSRHYIIKHCKINHSSLLSESKILFLIP